MRFIKQIYYHFAYLASLFLLISYSYALPNIVLTNCNIIDGRGTPIASDMVVVISDNKITTTISDAIGVPLHQIWLLLYLIIK